MKKIILLLISVLGFGSLFAQQESLITFYRNHMNLVNPAFIGSQEGTFVSSSLRYQWVGITNAPKTQAVSFYTPVGKKLHLGLSVINDEVFVEKQTNVNIDFSYRVDLNETLALYMGLKAGGNNYNVNVSGLESYNITFDPVLQNISRFNPNVGVGFYLKHDKYYISASAPRLLNTMRAKNEDGLAVVATDRVHFYLSGGYQFSLSEDFDYMPSTMIRYVDGAPFSVDFTNTFTINKDFDLGLTYRTDNTLAGFAGMTLNKFKFGYAYEYATSSQLIGRANGSHEIFLQFRLK
jgi:type IX secretion system PorP/SprF family membrane protein